MPSCVTGRTILRGPSRCPPTNAVSVHFRQPLHAHEAIDQLISGLLVVYPDDRFAPTYARLLAAIRQTGLVVAAMDLLIATAAVLDDAPVVTRNVKDFTRIPGLRVLHY